ncbi:MAG: GtrA family protein [Lachnospiraceae bacterium]|nr:GtrA family protein [Lachnospiraceae bacterium]
MDTIKNLYTKYRELIVYFITGVLTTLVNWASYAVLVRMAGWSVAASNTAAWIIAVIFAYVTNKLWVFRSYSWKIGFVLREAALFIGARILTGIFEIVSVPFLVNIGLSQPLFGVKGMWAKILVSVAVMVLNYVFSKLIVFRNTGDKQ